MKYQKLMPYFITLIFIILIKLIEPDIFPFFSTPKPYYNESYSGYFESHCQNLKGLPCIRLVNDNNIYYFNNDSIINIIQPGDMIIKNPGSAKYLFVRNGDTIVFYPEGVEHK